MDGSLHNMRTAVSLQIHVQGMSESRKVHVARGKSGAVRGEGRGSKTGERSKSNAHILRTAYRRTPILVSDCSPLISL